MFIKVVLKNSILINLLIKSDLSYLYPLHLSNYNNMFLLNYDYGSRFGNILVVKMIF